MLIFIGSMTSDVSLDQTPTLNQITINVILWILVTSGKNTSYLFTKTVLHEHLC